MAELERAVSDGVCLITLRRPEKRNALSLELRAQLADALDQAGGDGGVAATVVTGEGSAFCAGFDMTQFGGDAANRASIVQTTERFFASLLDHPKPLVSAVNGHALGGGFALACFSDIRIASPQAVFGFPQVTRGIPPSYAAARAALPAAIARELCLTGRLIDAAEARALGLVSEIVPPGELVARAQALARELAPPHVASQVKLLARADAKASWLPLLELEKEALRDAVLHSG